MTDATLENIKEFHSELVSISETGLPMELELGETRDNLADVLAKIADRIALATGRGQTWQEAIEFDEGLSPAYRSALFTWLYCDQSHFALESATALGATRHQQQKVMQIALVQPLVLAVLGYFAFIFICTNTVPKFEALNDQLEQSPGMVLATLTSIRDAMWVWVPLAPLLMLIFIVWFYRQAGRRPKLLADRGRGLTARIDSATYADRVASFIEQQIPLAQAMALAGPCHSPTAFRDSTPSPVSVRSITEAMPNSKSGNNQLPPLLRWAVEEHATGESRAGVLRFTAQTYRRFAALQAKRDRQWVPVIIVAIFGGLIVLGIGLSVFLPPIEFLLQITRQG